MSKKSLFPFLFLFILFSSCSAPQNSTQLAAEVSVHSWIDQEIRLAMNKNNIPSLSVGIIEKGKVEMLKGFGKLNRNEEKLTDENTLYQIASLSKMFTGTIANQLNREGLLEVNKSIVTYLPSSLSESTKEKLEKIRVLDLLHHRSGLPRDSKVVKRIDGEPFLGGYTEQQLLQDLELLELEAEAGEIYSYSNLAYGLLGYILERASGKSYDNLLNEYITTPLQMTHTASLPADKASLATPYRKDARARATKAWESGKLTPAGGLYSNVADLSKLMNRQLQDYYEYEQNKKVSPFIITEHKAPRNSDIEYYGFGLIEVNTDRGKIYGHQGDMDGFAGSYLFFPKYQVGVVILTSSGGNWLGKLTSTILKKLEEEAKTSTNHPVI
jgi:D-alanyl-D-alanine carboxypeptidase